MRLVTILIAALVIAATTGCAATGGRLAVRGPRVEVGVASFYAHEYDGRRTASGARYDERAMVAAHPTLPFGTRIRVTNLANGRSVVLRVVDRGPFRRGRVVDVSRRAARELGFLRQGTTRVRVEVLGG